MDLHSAISKAVKFVWNGKQASPLKNVRFLPGGDGQNPRLYANKGQQGIMLEVDQGNLPNVALDGETLAGIVRGTKSLYCLPATEKNCAVLLDGDDARHTAPLQPVGSYPGIPQLPDAGLWYTSPDWWVVEQVLHSVSKDAQQPHLQCLHFADGVIEATDRMRVARAFIDLPLKGLVLGDTFKNWPKGSVDFAVTEDRAVWFRMGEHDDEIRLSVLQRESSFPDLETVLPVAYDGPALAVTTTELMASLKKAVATKAEGVEVSFTPEAEVMGLACGGFTAALNGKTIRTPTSASPVKLRLNSKWLLEAVKVCETPRVLLGYGNGLDPLRIESGPYVEGIWPLAGG